MPLINPFSSKKRAVVLGGQARLTMWFVLVAIGAVIIGGSVVYVSGMASIQGTLGQTYCQIASRVADQFESVLGESMGFVGKIATDALTTEVAIEASDFYRNKPESWSDARLSRLAAEWMLANEALRKKTLHPQLSRRLAVLANLRGKSVISLSVFDRKGLLVAASDLHCGRVERKSKWFRAVSGKAKHFTYLGEDKKKGQLTIAIPIWGGVDIVGYVVANFKISTFTETVNNVRFGRTGEAVLVDYAGVPLEGTPRRDFIQALSRKPPDTKPFTPYWLAIPTEGELPLWRQLVCVAPPAAINAQRAGFDLAPWSIAVTQSPVESYATLRNSLGFFALVGGVGILVAGFGGAFMAWRIAAPIRRLRQDVHRFAQGQRLVAAKVGRRDEIGELALEFNKMAARVRESEKVLQVFAQAVEDAGDAIVMTDPGGRIYYANSAFETITGYKLEEVKGRDPSMLRSTRTEPEALSGMKQAIEQGVLWRGEIWNKRKNGEDYPVDLTVSPIRDEDDDLMAFIGIHRDMTLAHEYQDELEREVEARTREIRETQSLTVMGRMASMIAHDLRNALSTIKMNLQLLIRRHRDPEDVENEHCRMGLDQVSYMEEILRDMLSYARPEKLRRNWHDMPKLIDEALATFNHQAREQNVEIVHNGDERLPKVYCDRIKMLQVLRNLIQNAILAMPDGGRLSVNCNMTFAEPEPVIVITVTDTGGGIAEESIAEVLEPFFTTRARGTGLGLAIVKRLVEQHGGEVSINSRVGEGTSFKFTLPTNHPGVQDEVK